MRLVQLDQRDFEILTTIPEDKWGPVCMCASCARCSQLCCTCQDMPCALQVTTYYPTGEYFPHYVYYRHGEGVLKFNCTDRYNTITDIDAQHGTLCDILEHWVVNLHADISLSTTPQTFTTR